MAKVTGTTAPTGAGATATQASSNVTPSRGLEYPSGLKVTNRGSKAADTLTPITIAMYGTYGTGKSTLAASLSRYMPVVYFDLEGGVQSVLAKGNSTNVNLENLTLQPIYDTIETPLGGAVVKELLKGSKVALCKHGFSYGLCPMCKKDVAKYTGYCLNGSGLGREDPLYVFDSGTQVDMSIRTLVYGSKMNRAWDGDVDSSFHDWRRLGALWDYFGSEIQTSALKGFKVLMLFHEGEKGSKVFPLVGTKEYAPQFGRFWGSVIRTSVKSGLYDIQITTEGGRGHCKNRAYLPEDAIKNADDLIKLFE